MNAAPENSEDSPRRLALRAATRLLRQPGSLGNPVLFLGTEGSGRALLLKRIARRAKRLGRSVALLKPRSLVRIFRKEIRARRVDRLEAFLLSCDFLVLDWLEEFGSCRRAQSLLLSIWDRRVLAGRQIVLGSAVRPARISGLDPHLLSRIEAGFVLELSPPRIEKSLPALAEAVASRFDFSVPLMLRAGGHRAATARAALVALALGAGFRGGEIAAFLGGRSRAAVGHARRRSEALAAQDPRYRAALESLAVQVSPGFGG